MAAVVGWEKLIQPYRIESERDHLSEIRTLVCMATIIDRIKGQIPSPSSSSNSLLSTTVDAVLGQKDARTVMTPRINRQQDAGSATSLAIIRKLGRR